MRYDVKKFLFVGLKEEKDLFFKRAQEAGIIHFVNTKAAPAAGLPEDIQDMAKAIKVLRSQPVMDQEDVEEFGIADPLTKKILSIRDSLNALYEEERIIRLEISRVEVFGDFSLEDIAMIEKDGKRKIQFFCAKLGTSQHPELPDEIIYVGSDHGLDYFCAINEQPRRYPKMIEMIIERPVGQLKRRYAEVQKEIHSKEQLLKSFAKHNQLLHHAFINKLNAYHLKLAKNFVDFPLENEGLFVVQGWVPVHKLDALHELVQEMKIHVEEIDIDPNEVIPTYLENQGAARIGEDLVHIYDTPSNTDSDPSLWVLFFFALFFSMIIGDGGYGLILLLVAMYIRYKHQGLGGAKKRALNLLTILAFATIVWGALTTSFFGITIAPDNPVRRVSMMSWLVEKKVEYHIEHKDDVYQEWVKKFPQLEGVTNPEEFLLKASTVKPHGGINYEVYNKFSDNIMMELALLVGVLHIIISMGRYLNRNWSHLGWIIFIIGAYLYTPYFLGAASILSFVFGINQEEAARNGLYMMYGGMALAVVLALFKHKWLGLLEASVVIQIFGDVLSYLRLYALGLAGGLLTATMIDLAAGVPFFFGVLILLFGHLVNIVLGIMGGTIHGLRLNFLEWYHYSFEGGGKKFNPLKKQEIE